MRFRKAIGAVALAATLTVSVGAATAADDESKYPDLKGVWRRFGAVPNTIRFGLAFDPSKPFRQEQAPLTPEYQAIYNANIDDMEKGGQGIDPTFNCLSPGMPRVMLGYGQMEFVVTPETTYVLMSRDHDFHRHIYTDGRGFPENMAIEPRFLGYSIGKWIDTDGDGRYHALEVETRGLKGPRVFDASGIPLHVDNETVVQERIYLDKVDKNLLHDDITTTDHALTHPWKVTETFRRVISNRPIWFDHEVCGEENVHVAIGKEIYYLSGDGLLMPTVKDQPSPDLRYFRKYDR